MGWWVIDAAPKRQKSHIWSLVNPRQIDENRYQREKKVLSWVGLLGNEILGPFWFLEKLNNPVTVNGTRYLAMLQNQLYPIVTERRDSRRIWFLQDGAPPHCTDEVQDWLRQNFGDRIISRRSSIPWPAQSPDLNPLVFWFWGRCQIGESTDYNRDYGKRQ